MYYIGYYTTPDDRRISSPAANAKIVSISRALARNGIPVDILSTCTVARGKGWIPGRRFALSDGVCCKQYGLYATRVGPLRRLQYYLANFRLLCTLVFRVRKNENVLFYHAVERARVILLAKRIRKFRLIVEVEEVYADACNLFVSDQRWERAVFDAADAFIFPTVLLSQKVNPDGKPYALIHGTYECEEDAGESFDDGRIHVVYAGTLDEKKGGAWASLAAAEFLPENYALHILGFGTEEQMARMGTQVRLMGERSRCGVSFEGTLSGQSYIRFIQKCHIGLSTQNPEADYNDTSFPSKILSYMANGLQVLSVRIPAVETSAVGDHVCYYDRQSPEEIARGILSVDLTKQDSRAVIRSLERAFVKDVQTVL